MLRAVVVYVVFPRAPRLGEHAAALGARNLYVLTLRRRDASTGQRFTYAHVRYADNRSDLPKCQMLANIHRNHVVYVNRGLSTYHFLYRHTETMRLFSTNCK